MNRYRCRYMALSPEESTFSDSAEAPVVEGAVPVMGTLYALEYQYIATRIIDMAASQRVVHIMIDSPGGAVDGLSFVLDTIAKVRESGVTVNALVPSMALSAAYWIASACSNIVTASDARVGGIGVFAQVYDDSGFLENVGVKRFTFESSVSPDKVLDVLDEKDRKQIQDTVDRIGEKFISDVARGRGVNPEKVIQEFGQGRPVFAGEALTAGMIDSNRLIDYFVEYGGIEHV